MPLTHAHRILYAPGPYGPLRTWLGTEGGTERIIFQTGPKQVLRFYLSVKLLGLVRVRIFANKPYVYVGKLWG